MAEGGNRQTTPERQLQSQYDQVAALLDGWSREERKQQMHVMIHALGCENKTGSIWQALETTKQKFRVICRSAGMTACVKPQL